MTYCGGLRSGVPRLFLLVFLLISGMIAPAKARGAEWTPTWWVEDCILKGDKHQMRLVWLSERQSGQSTFMVVYGHSGSAYLVHCIEATGEITKVSRCWVQFTFKGISMGVSDETPCAKSRMLVVDSPILSAPFNPSLYLPTCKSSIDKLPIVIAREGEGAVPFQEADDPGYMFSTSEDMSWKVARGTDHLAEVITKQWGESLHDLLQGVTPPNMQSTRPPEPARWQMHTDLQLNTLTLAGLKDDGTKWRPVTLKGSNAFQAGDVLSLTGKTQMISAKAGSKASEKDEKSVIPWVSFNFQMRVTGVFTNGTQRIAFLASQGGDTSTDRNLQVQHQNPSFGSGPNLPMFSALGTWSKPDPALPPVFTDNRAGRLAASFRPLPSDKIVKRDPVLWCYVLDVDTGALLALRGFHEDHLGRITPSAAATFEGGHVALLLAKNFFRNQDCLQISSFIGQRKGDAHMMLKPIDPRGYEFMPLGHYGLKLTSLSTPITLQMLYTSGYAVNWAAGPTVFTAKPIDLKALMELARGTGFDFRQKHLSQININDYGSWSTQRGINPFTLMLHDGERYFSIQSWGQMATPIWNRMLTLDLASNTLTEISLSVVSRLGKGSPPPLMMLNFPEQPNYDVRPAPPNSNPANPPPQPPQVKIPDKY